jgi:hypothetical protein
MLKTSQKTISGLFNDAETAAIAIEPYVGVNDIYITLNSPDLALFELNPNVLTPHAKQTTGDSDIRNLNWLFVDFDPVRPTGVASMNDEKREAMLLAANVAKNLHKDFNFPSPIVCDSGNGCHLLFKIELENTRENVYILKNVLSSLDFLYSSETVKVDRVTYNPARITRLYGTLNCKGDNSEERPHRWSRVLKYPAKIIPVTIETLNNITAVLPQIGKEEAVKANDKEQLERLNVQAWLDKHSIEVAFVKEANFDRMDGTVYVLKTCPWNDEHTNLSARVVQFGNGAISAGCFHNGCQGKDWRSLKEMYEPGCYDKIEKNKDNEKETQFEKIVQISEAVTFFHDQKQQAFAIVPVANHNEVFKVESDNLKTWFSRQYYLKNKRAFSADAWTQAKSTFSGMALFGGEMKRMFTRCAWHNDELFYDLNDEEKTVVHVTEDGWEIIENPDVLFYRHGTMSSQVIPVSGGKDLNVLNKHYKFKHKDDVILHIVSLITKFLPQIPHPIDVVHGEKGASKTTSQRKDKSIVDPDRSDIRVMSKTKDDLAIMLDKLYFICLDNITNISSEISDLLCMAATGGTFVKRKLYSNDDETILEFMRPVSLSGINVIATKPDLLDRCILLELERLSPSERKTEKTIWEEFNADKPVILGMIFTILSKAMQIFPEVKLETLGRMADFTT